MKKIPGAGQKWIGSEPLKGQSIFTDQPVAYCGYCTWNLNLVFVQRFMIFTDFLIILAVRLQRSEFFFIEIGHDGYGIKIFKILRK